MATARDLIGGDAVFALCLPMDAAASLVALRLWPGLEVHEGESRLWLRGRSTERALQQRLLRLPALARYEVDAEGRCRRPGGRIPVATLPQGPWLPLRAWTAVELPPTALPGRQPPRVMPRVVPGGDEQPANGQWTTLHELAAFVEHVLDARLRPLCMAAGTDGRVLLLGRPLLPLPGVPLVERHGIAMPAGCQFAPRLSTAVVARALQLGPGDVACFSRDGTWLRVAASDFVALSRSAVRETLAAASGPEQR